MISIMQLGALAVIASLAGVDNCETSPLRFVMEREMSRADILVEVDDAGRRHTRPPNDTGEQLGIVDGRRCLCDRGQCPLRRRAGVGTAAGQRALVRVTAATLTWTEIGARPPARALSGSHRPAGTGALAALILPSPLWPVDRLPLCLPLYSPRPRCSMADLGSGTPAAGCRRYRAAPAPAYQGGGMPVPPLRRI